MQDPDIYRRWYGMLARQDPDKARREANRAALVETASVRGQQREDDIEELRALRAVLAQHMKASLLPYDEFTTFGLPSHGGFPQNHGVKECLTRDDEMPEPPQREHLIYPPAKLKSEILELEMHLRGGYLPFKQEKPSRPQSARLMVPRVSPRATYTPREEGVRFANNTARSRRPLSSVGAYRSAGLDPTTSARVEAWRSSPKYEEQMLIGMLKARPPAQPPPLWKLRRFERGVAPRVIDS